MDAFTALRLRLAACAIGIALAVAHGSAMAQEGGAPVGSSANVLGVGKPSDAGEAAGKDLATEAAADINAGLHESEQSSSRRPSPVAPRKAPWTRKVGDEEAQWSPRDGIKSVMRWIKSHLPFADDDEGESYPPLRDVRESSPWAEPPLGERRAQGNAGFGAPAAPGNAPVFDVQRNTATEASHPAASRDPEDDPLQRLVAVVRMVVEHPMTWLIVALFVIGGIAVRKFDRRPK